MNDRPEAQWSLKSDLLVVLGIADHMSESLDHETAGLSDEEVAMCDNLQRIRRKHFAD